ncbi:MAG: glycosyltransferase family 4 protein [Candidatus Xenobiia bacterium LiM19]
MHILEINDFPPPGGGAERHFLSLCRLLEQKGHHITTFFPMEKYRNGGIKAVTESLRSLLSRHYDCAHIHTLDHKLTSLPDIIKEKALPVIQTLHDHRSICLNGVMYRSGAICELCRGNRHYVAGLKGCVNLPFAFQSYIRRNILKQDIYASIDRFITPSRFLQNKFNEWGWRGELVYLEHFLELDEYTPAYNEESDYYLYFGRLSSVKGLHTLLEAAGRLPVPLRIVGGGEMKAELESQIESNKLGHVSLRGHMEGEKLKHEISGALFAVTPSECYENAPYAILEAFASGVPVVGSRCGGITELVGDNERGLLFPPGDSEALMAAMKRLCDDRALARDLGARARAYAESHFSPQRYYERFIELINTE